MATQAFTAAATNSTDANFRLWGKALSDALTAVGVLKTADTGQINWTTVTRPAAINTYQGYEIRVLSTPAGYPLYFRLDFGTGAVTDAVGLKVQIGTGTDGAGNLTGVIGTQFTMASSGSSVALKDCYVSGDTSRVNFLLFADSAGGNSVLSVNIGRSKSDAGADTTEGANLTVFSNATRAQQFIANGGAAYPSGGQTGFQSAYPPTGNLSYGLNVGAFPVLPNLGYAGNPCCEAVLYQNSLITIGTTFTLNINGQNRTFLACGATQTAYNANGNSTAPIGFGMRYE